ncbi:ABC transporter substrate-binding protein [Mycobacterium marseillense]|uniref:ABC transporter substrate-binding protein n=1 Tax=Mycobacterium marseillense TaxID=701042 RepID=A0ABM7JF05_9MYCO|nr:ABC transporter substrate-binding protein [Mycobacterium marseillense]MCV7404130.1 ABC transporter substrate-binding protein [Mycobacterium marseillense]ORA85953.1 ABC transporter substrate-binding protein [Mycobacterium marseillense]BBY12468.1 ABC transporter substrate-binding protein [Mycobacterium marseillense]
MSTRRRTALLLAAIAVLLPACVTRQQAAGPSAEPDRVPLSQLAGLTLRVGDQKSVGTEAMLRAAGELQDLPYRIDFSTFSSGPPMIEAATAGKIDFAITGDTPPIFGAVANARIKVVSAFDGGGPGDQILVHADSPIHLVTDLRGKTIALAKGSSAHANVLDQLDQTGLKPTDVHLVFLQPADALSGFRNGQVDAWAVWDPYTAQAEQQLSVRGLVVRKHKYSFGIASDHTLVDAKRNTALADLLARYARAAAWAREHPPEWAAQYAESAGIDPAVAAVAQGRTLRRPIPLDDTVVDAEQRLTDLLAAAGQIRSAPRFGNWVDHRFTTTAETR